MATHQSRRGIIRAAVVGCFSSVSGCLSVGSGEPDPIRVTADNNHSQSHEVDVTVTDPGGDVLVEVSTILEAESDTQLGSFTLRDGDTRETYAMEAVIDGETTKALEFPAGGASGTTSVAVLLDRDGTVELARRYE